MSAAMANSKPLGDVFLQSVGTRVVACRRDPDLSDLRRGKMARQGASVRTPSYRMGIYVIWLVEVTGSSLLAAEESYDCRVALTSVASPLVPRAAQPGLARSTRNSIRCDPVMRKSLFFPQLESYLLFSTPHLPQYTLN